MSLKAVNKKETNRVELEIEVDAAAFEAAVEKAYRKNINKLNIPGFRRGKAPRSFVEKMYGKEVFYEDAMNDLYPEALDAAIKESGYEYVEDKIDLDVVSVGEEGLVFKAVITVKPEVALSAYKGLDVTREEKEVTDEDVEAELNKLLDRNSRMVTVEGRAAENGDTVDFDFDGYVDDVAFDGGKAEHYSLVLGSGQFIPGFEDQIVGKNAGEEFDVNVTFPEDYHAEELKGKAAVFKCKLHEIKAKELPVADDEFAKDCSEFDTLDELKADLKAKLAESRKNEADAAFENALMDKLVENMTAEIPEAMFDNEVTEQVNNFAYRLQSQGMDMNLYLQYTGMDEAALRENFRPQAEQQVKGRLALEKVAALEGLTATEEEVEAEYARMAEMYKLDVERVKALVAADAVAKDMGLKKALDFIKENAGK
ncbi:MAG: trigger factor [Ruminococcaceae bacterium]|nr:trigger factor [Oscillospiraceae bacterium]